MLKCKTHYDQVPLEAVRRMVEEQLRRKAVTEDGIENERPEKGFAVMEEPSIADLSEFLAEES
jgi:hypothetical protein